MIHKYPPLSLLAQKSSQLFLASAKFTWIIFNFTFHFNPWVKISVQISSKVKLKKGRQLLEALLKLL